MKRSAVVLAFLALLAFPPLASSGGSSGAAAGLTGLLSANNLNLIFVVSPDLANDPSGDINPDTANLNDQGLQRSLRIANYLKWKLLGENNVNAIYALEPMTHLQTAHNYPDMAAVWFVQQFALLNQATVDGTPPIYSHPIGASYAKGSAPPRVVGPTSATSGCQGLDFDPKHVGKNVDLVAGIIQKNTTGFQVFSAPWETISALLTGINQRKGYHLYLPPIYRGPNFIYVLSIPQSGGKATLSEFDSGLNPAATYPELPPVHATSTRQQKPINYTLINGVNGVKVPPAANTNLTIYFIRHAEAHPVEKFEDGNYVGAGQWRALALPDFLPKTLRSHGMPLPDMVYSIDPAQSFSAGSVNISYVRPSLTVLPYAIANNLPYNLVSSFFINMASSKPAAKNTSDFFFTHKNSAGVNLSGHTVLVAWEHEHYEPLIDQLLASYRSTLTVPEGIWQQDDYDTSGPCGSTGRGM